MVKSQSSQKLLDIKKEKFVTIVGRVSRRRGLHTPRINFRGCPDERVNQLAHYHPKSNTICISEVQLDIQDFNDLEDTAAHEVTHVLEYNHSSVFQQEEQLSQIVGWEPPSGVVHIRGSYPKKPKKERKSREDKTRCNYHACRQKRKLTQCKYCKSYYCDKDIKSCEPRVHNERDDYIGEKGHPCLPYKDYLLEKEKEKGKKYSEALGKLLKKTSSPVEVTSLNYPTKREANKRRDNTKSYFKGFLNKIKSFFR